MFTMDASSTTMSWAMAMTIRAFHRRGSGSVDSVVGSAAVADISAR